MSKLFCKIVLLSLVIFITNSCTSDDDLSSEVPNVVHSESIYLENNKWIYSQMNHDYYWRTDMPDSLSCDYGTDPVTFYKSLLSKKDRFSYCENNPSYKGMSELVKYGFEYQNYSLKDQKFSQVLYVWDDGIKKQGLKRGDLIQFMDGNKIKRGYVVDNEFIPNDTLLLSGKPENNNSVYLDSIYTNSNNRIGYLCYMKFENREDLEPVLKNFKENNINELILDLRYNPGGYVSTCKYLANSIVPENGYGKVFQYCKYNDILTQEMIEETGLDRSISNYSTPNNGNGLPGNSLYGLNLKRLFVITSKYTASASEATIVCLKPYMDVVVIGEQTYGKGVGSWTIRDNRFRYQLQPITMRYYNANMESTPDDGIPVDYYMADGYTTSKKELGDINEPLLMKALDVINGVIKSSMNRSPKQEYRGVVKQEGNPSFFNIEINENENKYY